MVFYVSSLENGSDNFNFREVGFPNYNNIKKNNKIYTKTLDVIDL